MLDFKFNFIFIDTFIVMGYKDSQIVLISPPMLAPVSEIMGYCAEKMDEFQLDSAQIILARTKEIYCIVTIEEDEDSDTALYS